MGNTKEHCLVPWYLFSFSKHKHSSFCPWAYRKNENRLPFYHFLLQIYNGFIALDETFKPRSAVNKGQINFTFVMVTLHLLLRCVRDTTQMFQVLELQFSYCNCIQSSSQVKVLGGNRNLNAQHNWAKKIKRQAGRQVLSKQDVDFKLA